MNRDEKIKELDETEEDLTKVTKYLKTYENLVIELKTSESLLKVKINELRNELYTH